MGHAGRAAFLPGPEDLEVPVVATLADRPVVVVLVGAAGAVDSAVGQGTAAISVVG